MNGISTNEMVSDSYGAVGLFQDLWRAKSLVMGVTALCCILGLAAGIFLPKEYTAKVVFRPVLGDANSGGLGGGLNSLNGALGGLATLAGVSLPGKSEDKEAVAVLQSELLTRTFIEEQNLLPVLFPHDWDAAKQHWKGGITKKPPSLWLANKLFKKKIRKVVEDQKTGLYVLSIRWTNPKVAASWANQLISMTNTYLRGRAVRRSERSIAYLNSQAAITHDVEVKRAIYALLENQIDREMLARGRHEYALKVIDPAFVPKEPSSLSAVALGVLGLLFGALMSVLAIYVRGVLAA